MSWTLSGPLSLARPVALSPHCREPVVDKCALVRSTGTARIKAFERRATARRECDETVDVLSYERHLHDDAIAQHESLRASWQGYGQAAVRWHPAGFRCR
jgi:hypothetical protein